RAAHSGGDGGGGCPRRVGQRTAAPAEAEERVATACRGGGGPGWRPRLRAGRGPRAPGPRRPAPGGGRGRAIPRLVAAFCPGRHGARGRPEPAQAVPGEDRRGDHTRTEPSDTGAGTTSFRGRCAGGAAAARSGAGAAPGGGVALYAGQVIGRPAAAEMARGSGVLRGGAGAATGTR